MRAAASSASISTGSPLTLPEVATTGPSNCLEQQLVQRAVGQQHADLAQAWRDLRREVELRLRAQQHDRAGGVEQRGPRRGFELEPGRAACARPSAPRHGYITASGLSGRRLRWRSRATAAALRASHSRW